MASAGSLPPGLTWNWNLEGGVPSGADIIDYDPNLGSNLKTPVKRNGARYVICYFSAGSWENGRPDMRGLKRGVDYKNKLEGGNQGGSWEAGGKPERWLNIDSKAVRSVMVGRLVNARERGCDAVEPDNLDGDLSSDNKTGFNKTPKQVIAYYKFLADEAHRLGLMIGLKNADGLINQVVGIFDFVIVEECYKYKECDKYKPFERKGKAVLIAEYGSGYRSRCESARKNNFSLTIFPSDRMVKNGKPCR